MYVYKEYNIFQFIALKLENYIVKMSIIRTLSYF